MKKFALVLFVCAMFFYIGCEKQADSVSAESVGGSSDAVTVADDKGIVGKYPGQYELAEFENLTGENLSFAQNPIFSDLSEKVEARLPSEPLVMAPEYEIGTYGGTMRVLSRAPESGTAGVLSLRHANLVRMAPDFNSIIPDVAKSYEFNDDFTEITFVLREGHKWSDGHPFTTEDILFWWEDIQLNTDINSTLKSRWVFGGEPMKVEAIDDVTVKFSFAVPTPGFAISLAVDYVQPYQPKHVLKDYHKTYNPDVVSLAESLGYKSWEQLFGTYYNDWKDSYHPLTAEKPVNIPTIESHILYEESTEHRTFKANPYYHIVDTVGNQLPYTDEIYEIFMEDTEVKNLKVSQGEIDYKAQGMDLIDYTFLRDNTEKSDFEARLVSVGTGQMSTIGFNLTHDDPVLRELFNNLKFRQAMSFAINRDEINELIFLGTGKPMSYAPGLPARNKFITDEMITYMIDYDPERANALLDEIGLTKNADGFRMRSDGKPLVIYLTYSTQGGVARLWQLIKDYWDTVGVRVELKEVNSDLYRSDKINNVLDVTAWNMDLLEPTKFYESDATPFLPIGDSSPYARKWTQWLETNGVDGEQPAELFLHLIELNNEFIQQGYQSDRYNEIGAEMSKILVENMFRIGTVGDSSVPVIVHNRMGNVGEMQIFSASYHFNYPIRPCQFYIKY